MAPPPATIAQIHERFPAVAFAGTLGVQQFKAQQTTLGAAVSCRGIGLHSGAELTMRLVPAAADTGIVFIRTDITDRDEASIPALFGCVCDVTLSTKIGNSHGHVVGTVEHLLAALAGMRVDNVIVEIDGPEGPPKSSRDGSRDDPEDDPEDGLKSMRRRRRFVFRKCVFVFA